jgi:hypothetical protein
MITCVYEARFTRPLVDAAAAAAGRAEEGTEA